MDHVGLVDVPPRLERRPVGIAGMFGYRQTRFLERLGPGQDHRLPDLGRGFVKVAGHDVEADGVGAALNGGQDRHRRQHRPAGQRPPGGDGEGG